VSPVARSTRPITISGVELLPVNGNVVPPSPVNTDVELTVGPNDVLVPWPCTVVPAWTRVVVVTRNVDPDTSLEVVVEPDTVDVVSSCGSVVVVSCGWVVVEQWQLVGGTCSVVVEHWHVVEDVCVVVVWHSPHVLVVVGAAVVVVWHWPHVVVVDADVVDVEVDDDVLEDEVVDADVVVVTGMLEPQNCTLEMSGVLPWPTGGSPLFENEPVTCGGAIEYSTDAGPPFTMIAEIGLVDAHHAPSADSCDNVTTCSLPLGESKW
jgi:hypothetical protein